MNFWSNATFIFIFLLLCFLTPPTFLETAHTSNMLILLVYLNPFHVVFPHPDMLSLCNLGPFHLTVLVLLLQKPAASMLGHQSLPLSK